MKTVDECRQAIADHVRANSPQVDKYLETARTHAGLLADLASAACRERWPELAEDTALLARLRLSDLSPEKLTSALDAAKAMQGIEITSVYTCRESMSVYLFGRKTP